LKISACLMWRGRVRARTRRCSFDHRHREVGITTARDASAILHGGRRCSRIGTVDGRYAGRRDGEVERRDGYLGTLQRNERLIFATPSPRKRRTYLVRLLLRFLTPAPCFVLRNDSESTNQINYSREYQSAGTPSSFLRMTDSVFFYVSIKRGKLND